MNPFLAAFTIALYALPSLASGPDIPNCYVRDMHYAINLPYLREVLRRKNYIYVGDFGQVEHTALQIAAKTGRPADPAQVKAAIKLADYELTNPHRAVFTVSQSFFNSHLKTKEGQFKWASFRHVRKSIVWKRHALKRQKGASFWGVATVDLKRTQSNLVQARAYTVMTWPWNSANTPSKGIRLEFHKRLDNGFKSKLFRSIPYCKGRTELPKLIRMKISPRTPSYAQRRSRVR